MCFLVLICFVFEFYYQKKDTTSRLAPPRPPSVKRGGTSRFFGVEEKLPMHRSLHIMFVLSIIRDEAFTSGLSSEWLVS